LPTSGHGLEGTTLGRILDTGNYEPDNVFWMTMGEQMLHRRNKRALLNPFQEKPPTLRASKLPKQPKSLQPTKTPRVATLKPPTLRASKLTRQQSGTVTKSAKPKRLTTRERRRLESEMVIAALARRGIQFVNGQPRLCI
jgi:hypothetical protein